ncbi:hypothetical protein G9A89_015902 [Geosiphon pyriformis]|nr:hypothetical protein G9A89_015902 [Geosiphon pyriformis]
MPLDYVDGNAFFSVIKEIDMAELSLIINGLPNNKAAGLSEIPNKLWKHCDDTIWIISCQAFVQYILNIASEFFEINGISINNDKTVAILIN